MKIIKIILIAVVNLFLIVSTVHAQTPTFEWVKQMGGTGYDHGNSITTDANGNVYVTGDFSDTVDFDPGAGISNLMSVDGLDIFIQKLDANGNLLWVKQMGGTGNNRGNSIIADSMGNVYAAGIFSGTVDFDPGVNTFNLTSFGGRDVFIQKLDFNGNFLWVKQMGGAYVDYVYSITTDANGYLYATGTFNGTADFDPGVGTANLTSAGGEDIFIQKLDANGNLIWVKQMGGTVNDRGLSITTDANRIIYSTGIFMGTVDFDPGVGTANLTSIGSHDNFIQKLDTNGNLLWVKQMGGTGYTYVSSITTDANGNVYTVGAFEATVDFDPGFGTFNLTSVGWHDIFIQKLDSNGNLLWVKQIEDTNEHYGLSITTDAIGNLYTTGMFSDTVDFDPGANIFNLTSVGNHDIFIQKLDANGNLLWVKQMGGTGHDFGNSITVDANENVYAIGGFDGIADFDPGFGFTNLTPVGLEDIFIHKLSQSVVGILEYAFPENHVIYPNPTDGKFSIEFKEMMESLTVSLYSLSGQLIMNKIFQNTNIIQLEINQPNGMYLLEILDKQGNKVVSKIIK